MIWSIVVKRLYHPSSGEDFYRYRDESIFDDIAPSSLPVPVDQDEIVEHGFAALEKSDGRIVVLGGPGTGKSTLLKYFAGNQAKKLREQGNHPTISRNTPLPVFIILPDLVRSKKSLREYLATRLEEQFIDAEVANIVWEVIASGCAFVCLDSLDEVILQRDQLVQTLRRIIQGSGQGTRWVISSRFTDYVWGQFEDGSLVEWELLPLDDTLRRQLAQHLIPELQKLIPNPHPVQVVIVTHIWQKLSSVERRVTLIVMDFWQLFSRIFGRTLLVVTNMWRNQIVQIPTALTGRDRFRGG